MELTHRYKETNVFINIVCKEMCKLHFTASLIEYFKYNNLLFFCLVLYNIENLACVIIFLQSDKVNLLQSYL